MVMRRIAICKERIVRVPIERSVDELRGCVQYLSGDAHPAWMRGEHHILDRLPRREDNPPNLPVGWKPSRPQLLPCRANNHQPRWNRNKIGVTAKLVTRANYLGNVGDGRQSFDASAVLTPLLT